jgi:hypothetical protein
MACSDSDKSTINGMWQLKTIEDSLHHIQPVDTIFYAFQRQSIFSYTLLYEHENQPATCQIIYGYIDFPDPNRLHIQLDERFYNSARYTLWQNTNVIYDIIHLDSKRLTLSKDRTFYYFNKY